MKVLVTGITGKVGQVVAEELLAAGHTVVGIDRRPWPDAPAGVVVHQVDIRKRGAEDVFRTEAPDALVHMATVTHLTTQSEDRYRINLGGTKSVFDFAHKYGVKHDDLRRAPHLLRRRRRLAALSHRGRASAGARDVPGARRSRGCRPVRRERSLALSADRHGGSAHRLHARRIPLRHAVGVPQGAPRSGYLGLRSAVPFHARAGRGPGHRGGAGEALARRVQRLGAAAACRCA